MTNQNYSKMITHTPSKAKLFEPYYFRNTFKSGPKLLEHKISSPMLLGSQENSIVKSVSVKGLSLYIRLGLLDSVDFSQRNFGSKCDRDMSNQTSIHRLQKFGNTQKRNVRRLQPLDHRGSKTFQSVIPINSGLNILDKNVPTDINSITRRNLLLNLRSVSILDDVDGTPPDFTKKSIKQVYKEPSGSTYYTVLFAPPKITVQEKVSKKIVKQHFGSLRDFLQIITYSQQKRMSHFLDESVKVSADLPPEAFDYKLFQKAMKIKLQLDETEAEQADFRCQENELFNEHMNEIEINNKHFQIIYKPPILELYDHLKTESEALHLTTNVITQMIKRSFVFRFSVI